MAFLREVSAYLCYKENGPFNVVLIFRMRGELLTLSAYIGALVAIRRKYDPVVEPLFQTAL